MSRIAILGATSQIARDLIPQLAKTHELFLFGRRVEAISHWVTQVALAERPSIADYAAFSDTDYDAVINFVGSGDPARTASMGRDILNATLHFDSLALDYLRRHTETRYLFLSSGAVYGTVFTEPATGQTPARLNLNDLQPAEYYSAAKLSAEIRHRLEADLAIFDIRIFNYFSRSQDMAQRFFLTDIVRAIRDDTTLLTSPDYIVRDFLHREDFFRLVSALLSTPPANAPVDCYSRATIDKPGILTLMQDHFGLRYEVSGGQGIAIHSTGQKAHYYSTWRHAGELGYLPQWDSAGVIRTEAAAILGR